MSRNHLSRFCRFTSITCYAINPLRILQKKQATGNQKKTTVKKIAHNFQPRLDFQGSLKPLPAHFFLTVILSSVSRKFFNCYFLRELQDFFIADMRRPMGSCVSANSGSMEASQNTFSRKSLTDQFPAAPEFHTPSREKTDRSLSSLRK